MSRQVILHIGGEKTGTTTLQRFLTRNASRLQRDGYCYPCEANDICFENFAHFPVAACLIHNGSDFVSEQSRRNLPFILEALERAVSATKQSVVLSCEHFSSRLTDVGQLKTLRDALPADLIKVIFYIREQCDLALSSWSTAIRSGSRNAFDVNDITPKTRYYNHLETIKLWGSVFWELNLVVREYNRAQLVGGDIREDFSSLLGIQSARLVFEKDENQALDAQRLRVLRYINEALPGFGGTESEWKRTQNVIYVLSKYIPRGEALQTLISDEERSLIKSRFVDVNREISERYFDGNLSAGWFPDCAVDGKRNICDDGNKEVAALLRETIIRIAEAKIEDEFKLREVRFKRKVKKLLKKLELRFAQSAFAAAARKCSTVLRRRMTAQNLLDKERS